MARQTPARSVLFIVVVLLLVFVTMPVGSQGQSGTTLLDQYVTAAFSWTRTIDYDWTITKSVSPAVLHLEIGDSATVGYTIEVTRSVASDVTVATVTGIVCETNGGAVATTDLTIVAKLQKGSPFVDVLIVPVDVSSNPVLDPGEEGCYPYSLTFTPVPGGTYRIAAKITITNHSGHLGVPFGPEPKTDSFTVPAAPTLVELDATADIADVMTCPAGFTCVATASDWNVTGDDTIQYEATFTNVDVCETAVVVANTATLTASDGETHSDSARVDITTGDCPATGAWCSPGYWRQEHHLSSWPAGASPNDPYTLGPVTLSRQGQRNNATLTPTLWQVLQRPEWYGGDSFNKVGDYLSTLHPDVNFTGERIEDSCPLN